MQFLNSEYRFGFLTRYAKAAYDMSLCISVRSSQVEVIKTAEFSIAHCSSAVDYMPVQQLTNFVDKDSASRGPSALAELVLMSGV